MSKLLAVKGKVKKLTLHFPLTRTFFVFSILYFPVSVLFLGRGTLSEVMLTLYTLIMVVLATSLILRFMISFASSSNARSGQLGSLFILYMINVLFPLCMFKVFVHIGWWLLPTSLPGFWCEVTCFIKDMYFLFDVQTTLNWVIVVSLTSMFLITLWNTQKK